MCRHNTGWFIQCYVSQVSVSLKNVQVEGLNAINEWKSSRCPTKTSKDLQKASRITTQDHRKLFLYLRVWCIYYRMHFYDVLQIVKNTMIWGCSNKCVFEAIPHQFKRCLISILFQEHQNVFIAVYCTSFLLHFLLARNWIPLSICWMKQ